MKKIVVVGCPASGKTTLVNQLRLKLDNPILHLDKIFWVEEKGIAQDSFIAQQEQWMRQETWIIDGNYMKSKSFDIRLENADTIIFFEFPKIVLYWRLLKRYLKHRNVTRPDMGGNKKDRLNWSFLKFIWNYPTEEIRSKVLSYKDTKDVYILHSNKEVDTFLHSVK